MAIHHKFLMLMLITLCVSTSLLFTTFAQTSSYSPLQPMPPTKRIPFTWNVTDCWTCHYIPAPMAPETFEMTYLPKLIYQQPYPHGQDFPVFAETGLWRSTFSGRSKGIADAAPKIIPLSEGKKHQSGVEKNYNKYLKNYKNGYPGRHVSYIFCAFFIVLSLIKSIKNGPFKISNYDYPRGNSCADPLS